MKNIKTILIVALIFLNVGLGVNAVKAATVLFIYQGGTGASSFTDAGVIIGNGTGALQVTTAGSAGEILTSNGAGVDPTFQAAAAASGEANDVSTSTSETAGRIAYFTSNSATPALLGEVATTSSTIGTGLAYSGTFGSLVGGVNGTLTFDATQLDAVTFSDGANASNVWTNNVSGTDTTLTWGSALITLSGGFTINGTLSGVSGIDATTESTIETAIDTLSNLTTTGTIGTGAWEATDVGVAHGGTGKSSWTQYLIPYADTTTSFSQIAIGTSGQVLTSNGAGSASSFQTLSIAAGEYAAGSIDGDDINSNIAGRSLTLTAASPDTLDADAELYTRDLAFNYASSSMATSTEPVLSWLAPQASTITSITCNEVGASATSTVMFEERTALNTAGTDVLYGDGLTAGGDIATASSTLSNNTITSGSYLIMTIEGYLEGSPNNPICDVKITYDD